MELTADQYQLIAKAIVFTFWCAIWAFLSFAWHSHLENYVEGLGRTLGTAISETSPKNIEAKLIEQEIQAMKLALLKVAAGKK